MGRIRILLRPRPDAATDTVARLKVLYPTRARLKFFFRNVKQSGGFLRLLSYQTVGKGCLASATFIEPF